MIKRFIKTVFKKNRRKVLVGRIHIKATSHNTRVTITDSDGKVISCASAGASGFKSKKKSSPFAAQITTENALKTSIEYGLQQVEIVFNGPGKGRETALRTILNNGYVLGLIRDVTPLPHNGCRAPKKRRT
jgi:small subunit ribosomal protein S11